MIAKVHTTNEMADEEIFVWGEDFEAVLAILEEDETVDLHFTFYIPSTNYAKSKR